MGIIITATKLWQDGVLSLGGCPVSINCELLAGLSPRTAWLKPEGGCCGDANGIYGLTLQRPPAGTIGVLEGVWVELLDGSGMLLDADAVASVRNGCNACCGATPTIPGRYNGVFPTIADLVPATYTFTRVDEGDIYAIERVALDYLRKAIPGTVVRTTYDAGTSTSTYTFSAYFEPVFLGTDTKTGETSKVFDSNTPPTLAGAEILNLTMTADGVQIVPVLTAANLAALVAAATASAAYNVKGTYSAVGGKVRLTTTVVNQAVLVVGKQNP
jgi:hypothetical protein